VFYESQHYNDAHPDKQIQIVLDFDDVEDLKIARGIEEGRLRFFQRVAAARSLPRLG
jgi:hypothetical protein